MTYQFDPEHYKKIFDQMFGAGSYDKSIQQAQNLGRLKAQVDIAKQAYSQRLKAAKQAQLHPKKTYQDAVDYWGANPGMYQGKGAYAVANDILNDPAKQAEIKSQGYNISDYINGLYDASSGGKFRSQREYNQYTGNLKNDIAAKDKAYKAQHNGMSEQQVYDTQQKLNKLKPKKKPNTGLLGNIGGLFQDVGHDVSQKAKGAGNELSNIWKAISDGPGGYTLGDVANATQNTVKKQQKQDVKRGFSSNLSKEVHRGTNRAMDAASLGVLSDFRNKENQNGYNWNTNFTSNRPIGKGGVTDFLTSGLGYLAPGSLAYKGTKALRIGDKTVNGLAKLGTPNKLAKLGGMGMEGATAGGLFGAEQNFADPSMTLKQGLQNIGLNTALGAVGDPLLHGLGAGLSKLRGKSPKVTTQSKQPLLGLPEPKMTNINVGESSIPGVKRAPKLQQTQQNILALPEGKFVSKPRFASPTNPSTNEMLSLPPVNPSANEILDKLLPKIKPEVEQAMTPPFENPRELKKWIRSHTDISVKQLDTLPPKDLTDMAIQVRNSLRLPDVAQEIAHKHGYDLSALLNGQVKDMNGVIARRNFAEAAGIPQNKLNMDILNNPQVGTAFAPRERFVPMDTQPLNFVGKNTKPLSLKVQSTKKPQFVLGKLNNLPKNTVSKMQVPLQYVGKIQNPIALKAERNPDLVQQIRSKLGKEALNTQQQPNLLQNLKMKSPKNQVAAALENISPKKNNEPKLVRADSIPSPNQKLLDGIDTSHLKDTGGFKAYTSDVYRIFQDVFGKHFNQIKQRLLDPFDKAKGENVDLQKSLVNQLERDVIQKLGIKPNSKESALVQMFGEGEISLDELKKRAPLRWKNIVTADKWFRAQYNMLIDQVNAVRAKLYPNQPDKLVPKRKDYYRHFKELDGLEGLKNLFDTPANIDPQLAGTSEFTRPNSRYASFMQKRGLGPYKRDAVGGYLNYVPAATYAIKIDPYIKQFNQLANELADSTSKTKHLNTFIGFLKDFSGDLAGKTNFLDRPIQKVLGRQTFNALHWLNKRVKANVILGNMSSTLAQVANVPQGVAFAKQYSAKGAVNTLKSILDRENSPIKSSDFVKERYGHNMYNKFDTRWINQPKRFASWMMEAVDHIGTSFIWNSAYEKGLAQKVANPVKYADDATRKLVAGRGIGEVPLAQKSKIVQLIAPFQLEVANLWRVQKDFLKAKDVGGLITLYLAAHMLNKEIGSIRGNGVAFDPVQAIMDASQGDLTPLERGGRLAGEILSNLPLGQSLANFYPEYGTKNLPTRQELFGKNDPNRFGSGLLIAKGVQDPLAKVVLPYGGNQLEKTLKGLSAISNEGVYNKQNTQLNYPVNPNFENRLKSVLFGPGAFKETQNYFNQNLRPLSPNQTKIYNENKKAGSGIGYYNLVQQNRVESNIKKVLNNTKLNNKQKDNKLQDLIKRLKALQAQ